jgi:hypothetical protein
MFTSDTAPSSLVQQYQKRMDQLLHHQKDSCEKGRDAVLISERILDLNNQIIAENSKLANVEKSIAANSSIIEYICSDMKKIGEKVRASLTINLFIEGANRSTTIKRIDIFYLTWRTTIVSS